MKGNNIFDLIRNEIDRLEKSIDAMGNLNDGEFKEFYLERLKPKGALGNTLHSSRYFYACLNEKLTPDGNMMQCLLTTDFLQLAVLLTVMLRIGESFHSTPLIDKELLNSAVNRSTLDVVMEKIKEEKI